MHEITDPTGLPEGFPGSAVAIGKFDGLHLGHRQLLHELVEYCEESALGSIAITFDKNPKALFDPQNCPAEIVGPKQKSELVESVGVDVLITLEFNQALASLSPKEFIERYIAPLGAQMVFVGEDFTFGAKGLGTIDDLRNFGPEFGFRAREIPNVLVGDSRISSTQIRKLLESGNVSAAALLLGRNHVVRGEVEHGRKLGRTLGFPTANLSRDSEGLLPADGIYAGYLIAEGVRYPAAHSVGTNDSVGEVPRLLESHVIGRDDLDLYGQIVECEFVDQVRGWQKFDSLEALVEQIGKDVAQASKILGE
jgi:riboflavin kinase / FMN adenylyltransferase